MSLCFIFCNNHCNWCCCEGNKHAMIEPLAVCGGSYWKIACDALFRADIRLWELTQTFNSSALFKGLISHFSRSFIPHSSLERGTGFTPCQICALRSKNCELISEELCVQADNKTCSESSEYEVFLLASRFCLMLNRMVSIVITLMFWQ